MKELLEIETLLSDIKSSEKVIAYLSMFPDDNGNDIFHFSKSKENRKNFTTLHKGEQQRAGESLQRQIKKKCKVLSIRAQKC